MSYQVHPDVMAAITMINAMSTEILRDKLTADEYEPDLQLSLTPEDQERQNRARFLRAAKNCEVKR